MGLNSCHVNKIQAAEGGGEAEVSNRNLTFYPKFKHLGFETNLRLKIFLQIIGNYINFLAAQLSCHETTAFRPALSFCTEKVLNETEKVDENCKFRLTKRGRL